MAREKLIDAVLLPARLTLKRLEQFDHPSAVPAGACEDRHSQLVSLLLLEPAELQDHTTSQQARGCLGRPRTAGVAKKGTEQTEPPLRDHPLGEPVRAVTPGDVRNLMSQDGGDL